MASSVGDSARQGGAKGLPRSLEGLVDGIDRGEGVSYGLYQLSGNQDINVTAPNHIQFDQELQVSADMVGSLSVGTAQQLGIVTLPAGKVWECEAAFSWFGDDGNAQLCCSMFDLLAGAVFGVGGFQRPLSAIAGANSNHSPQGKGFIDTRERSGIVTIEFRILSGGQVDTIFAGTTSTGPTWLKVRSI